MNNDSNEYDAWEHASNPNLYLSKKDLKGSASRDAFKSWHKKFLDKSFISTDLDLVFVGDSSFPNRPGIVAVIDYKRPYDTISYAEVLAYNQFVEFEIPVFIVEAEYVENKPFEKFNVKQYIYGAKKPIPQEPDVKLKVVLENASPSEFEQWEARLRIEYNSPSGQMERLRKQIENLNEQYKVFAKTNGKSFPQDLFEKWHEWIKISKASS
jgi:hypothetical protein